MRQGPMLLDGECDGVTFDPDCVRHEEERGLSTFGQLTPPILPVHYNHIPRVVVAVPVPVVLAVAYMDASAASQPSTSANHQAASSSSSSGPQVRSRVTVVCGECKRLKLKCDRKVPCGSCAKRDTIARCTYSQAAAEKVDLHSVHNRVSHIEAHLTTSTNGIFQSSFPYSATAGPSTHASSSTSAHPASYQHHHHHHDAAPFSHTLLNDSISISLEGLRSIWLDDLELGLFGQGSTISTSFRQRAILNAANSTFVKLESSPIDIFANGDEHAHASVSRRAMIPRTQLRLFLRDQRAAAHNLLPPMSVYFPVPSIPAPGSSASSSAPFPHQPSSSSASGGYNFSSSPQPQSSRSQLTPALLNFLPSLDTCQRLLHSASEVFKMRPLPFGPSRSADAWKKFESKCLRLLGGGPSSSSKERERREKQAAAKRARAIYFASTAGRLPGQDTLSNAEEADSPSSGATGDAQGHSLTFWAMLCAVLAVGASASASLSDAGAAPSHESPAFFYALSQHALGLLDTEAAAGAGASSGGDDTEKMEYLLACLLGAVYLLISGTVTAAATDGEEEDDEDEGADIVRGLIGKMVNKAQALKLDQESSWAPKKGKNSARAVSTEVEYHHASSSRSSSTVRARKEKDVEKEQIRAEWKRMIWWEILFYDLFTADVLAQQPLTTPTPYSTKLPAFAQPSPSLLASSSLSTFADAEEGVSEEDEAALEQDANTHAYLPSERSAPQPTSTSAPVVLRDEEAYLAASYRLTQISQAVKKRNSLAECCCGYTLDQAVNLENEVRRWHETLPASLQVPSYEDLEWHSEGMSHAERTSRMQGFELAIMANLLAVNAYMPFLRPSPAVSFANGGSGAAPSSSRNTPATYSCAMAASAIVHHAKALQDMLASSWSASASSQPKAPLVVLPALFELYPLDKLVFDSLVICAHSVFSGTVPALGNSAGMFKEAVRVGLAVLDGLDTNLNVNAMKDTAGAVVREVRKEVLNVLKRRVGVSGLGISAAGGGVRGGAGKGKRKWDQLNPGSGGAPSDLGGPPSGSGGNGAAGGGGGEGMLSGFDFSGAESSSHSHHDNAASGSGGQMSSSSSQYLHNGIPVAQQQHHDIGSSSSSSSVTPTSAVPSSSRRNSGDRDKERERSHSHKDKKSSTVKKASYPNVGIRIRDSKAVPKISSGTPSAGSSSLPTVLQGSMQAPPPLMTSKPRPLPTTEAILAMKKQMQQQQTQQVDHTLAEPHMTVPSQMEPSSGNLGEQQHDVAGYRSRSSSVSYVHVQPQTQLEGTEFSLQYGPSLDIPQTQSPETFDNLDMPPRKRQHVQDIREHQQHHAQQQHQTLQPASFAFDQGRQQTQSHGIYDQATHMDMGYAAATASASPFSSSSSPFAATASSPCQPPTPTFTPSVHHQHHHQPTPPVFGPSATPSTQSASPATYYHAPTAYGPASFEGSPAPTMGGHPQHHQHEQQQHGHGVSLSELEMGMGQSMISMPSTPVYEKPLDGFGGHHAMLQHQHHHQQMNNGISDGGPGSSSYDHQDMSGQQMVGMASVAPWASPAPTPIPSSRHTQPQTAFWNDNSSDYKFYQQ